MIKANIVQVYVTEQIFRIKGSNRTKYIYATKPLEILLRLGVSAERIKLLKERFERRQTVTHVKLGGRPTVSRDPDDNLVLATALAGKAKFLITNDRDLLDMPASAKRKFKFAIVTPSAFLTAFEAKTNG